MIRCPSSGQPCHHEVCASWPCDPSAMAALEKRPPMPDEPEPVFEIYDDEEPEFISTEGGKQDGTIEGTD